jgi:hypothetical protein
MSNFEHDYVEFDERGFKCLRCQCCGTTIADWTRSNGRSTRIRPRRSRRGRFIRLSNFRTARVVL